MPSKPVWDHPIQRDAWVEKHCDNCFQRDQALQRIHGNGPGCPHLARAETGKLPTPWKRRRNAVWGDTYSCSEFTPRPPVNRRGKVDDETLPMLDIEETDRNLVPVDGWPDYQAEQRKLKEGDHQ